MAFQRRWLLVFFALILSGGPLLAAGKREQRDYAAAVAAYQDEMWNRAETEFADFVAKYPESTNVPEVVLLAAQAEFKQNQFTNAIALLDRRKSAAGALADQYAYWIGEAQFQNEDFASAADTWIALTQEYPESQLCLRAVVEAAAAFGQVTNWMRVDDLLGNTNGVFQRAAQLDPGNKLVVDGQLSLENSKYQQRDFPGVVAVYELLTNQWQTLNQVQQCQGTYLFYRVKVELGDFAAALAAATNLVQIASLPTNQVWLATAWAAQGATLKQLGRMDEAKLAYQQNLSPGTPGQSQRQAVLEIASMATDQADLTNAEAMLQQFLTNQIPAPAQSELALLTLGELQLKAGAGPPADTNQLAAAETNFYQFLATYTNSPLAGKAYLDRGWCKWLAGDTTNSLEDFKEAAQWTNLPPEDLAVARFKTGDAQFSLAEQHLNESATHPEEAGQLALAQTNFADALENYRAVVEEFTNFPAVAATLGDRALYQMLRANLALTNTDGASNALAQILERFPASNLATYSKLLYGEGLADARRPADARAVFQQFLGQYPDSPLRPQVEFAIARTFELEQNWPDAIAKYEGWLKDFPTNDLLPQADYALAWANYQAGNETNAFGLFTNFVAQFPASELAPQAQWWVADYFFNQADYLDAERNYELFYQNTNWQGSPLIYHARMMAGRAAVARQDYANAIRDYFRKLEEDTNCPASMRAQAAFAHGSALMSMDSIETNNPLANFPVAAKVFAQIALWDPTNELVSLAMIEIGKCDLQVASYGDATNAYAQVVNSTNASVSARSQAQIGIGIALEKMAALVTGTNQTALLDLAKNNYEDVLFTKNLRDDETADSFWVEKAGLQAAAAAETMGEWDQAADIYGSLKKWLPQLSGSLDKMIAEANAHLPPKKN